MGCCKRGVNVKGRLVHDERWALSIVLKKIMECMAHFENLPCIIIIFFVGNNVRYLPTSVEPFTNSLSLSFYSSLPQEIIHLHINLKEELRHCT